jgi:hypothetical protein
MTKREIVKTVYDTVDGQTFECIHEAEKTRAKFTWKVWTKTISQMYR